MTGLTDFERPALEATAPLFGDLAAAFLEQVSSAIVTNRKNTGVGFYTSVVVDRQRCLPVPMRHQGAHFEVERVEHGVGIVLWDIDGDGYLETIEGWTVGDNTPLVVDLSDLKFVRLEQLG